MGGGRKGLAALSSPRRLAPQSAVDATVYQGERSAKNYD